MTDVKLTFKRFEKKYLLSPEQYLRLRLRLDAYIEPDEFFRSTVCSIYYDTKNFDLIRSSIESPVYKEKLRLRSYNVPSPEDAVFVELKKKFKGVVYKRRAMMAERDAAAYLAREAPARSCSQVTREIDWFLKTNAVYPRVFIASDREAYLAREDGELRFTFDSAIRWRETELSLTSGSFGENILPEGQVLMEIKTPESAPLWLARLLSEEGLYPTKFSKYGSCYKTSIIKEVVFNA